MILESILEPVVAAARETLSIMLRLDAVDVTTALASGVAPVHEVSAVVGLGGSGAHGALVLSTDRATAVRLVSRLAGQTFETFDDDVADGLGELANIIAGAAKGGLRRAEGGPIDLALPTIVAGAGHQIFRTKGVSNRLAFLSSELGSLCVQIHLRVES